MKHYVGLDASQTSCAVCVLLEDGTRVIEGAYSTDPGVWFQLGSRSDSFPAKTCCFIDFVM